MIKGTMFTERVKTNYKRTGKDGKVSIQFAIRVCDECGEEKKCRWDSIIVGRERRKGKIDLCKRCSNGKKYRKMPLGKKHGNYKHGLNNGYKILTVPDRRRMFEHIWLVEKKLGRKIKKPETVHHIDMDKTNNNLCNLYLFENNSCHRTCHANMQTLGYQLLNKHIWFDYKNKKYSLDFKKRHKKDNVQLGYKIYVKKSCKSDRRYNACCIKMPDGSWQWRNYHVLLMEKLIGRKIYRDECIHHIDGNSLNNDINNLCLMTNREHTVVSAVLQKCVAKLYTKGLVSFEDGIYTFVGSKKKWSKKHK